MPARLIGRRVRVQLGASHVVVFDGLVEVARHERGTTKGGQVLLLDHYLEVLVRKPGALSGATALALARARGCSRRPTTPSGRPTTSSCRSITRYGRVDLLAWTN